jgi:methylated-DNA-protein-cysteine methyltransferase-like protein
MSDKIFTKKVYDAVSSIPKGRVATYGQIAAMIGEHGKAQAVGWVLRPLGIDEREIPWWRVVNAKGIITINHGMGGIEKNIQAQLLRDDGVEVSENGKIDMERFVYTD